MEADWDEVHRIPIPPSKPHEVAALVCTLAFDTQQELLWVGNEHGRIASYFGPELRSYTSVRAHDGRVKQFLFHEKGVLSVSARSVHLCLRRGLWQWHIAEDGMIALCCMCFLGKDSSVVLVAGRQNVMFKIDVEKGQILEEIATEDEYTQMKYSHYICAATTNGTVNVLDPDSLRILKTLSTNCVEISDMDARNNYLVTCGWTSRPGGTSLLAGLANVYDLRAMVQLPPIAFHAGAAYIQMHPRMSTTCIIASQGGQLQVVDLMNSNTVNLRQANVSTYLVGLVLASSGEALAMADADGSVHLWGSPSKLHFAEYSNPTVFADTTAPTPFIDVNSDLPLSTTGMPFYREQLLSAWSSSHIYEVGNPPSRIDSTMLGHALNGEGSIFIANPRKERRNQAKNTRLSESNGALAAPKFLSEKAKASESNGDTGRRISDVMESLANTVLSGSTKVDVPVMYRNVEIKYSKFGVDDFDFEFFNKTQYAGLETHIANSYTNPLLQLFKFTPLVRNLALSHAAGACLVETCLLCELGFLFDMLEKAEGQSCQATNFLKTLSNISQAAKLGILEENSHNTPLSVMMQSASRFLLEQMSVDFGRIAPHSIEFRQTLGVDATSSIRCSHCRHETRRSGGSLVNDLVYQPVGSTTRMRNQIPSFSQVLKASIERESHTRAWCDRCRRYQQLVTRKSINSVPLVLVINAAIKNSEAQQLWAIPGWLPDEIGVIVDGGKFFCFEGEDLKLHLQRNRHLITVYDLVGIVADINSGEHQKSHLVSLINVAISERSPTHRDQWHLFNDFLVKNISKDEALRFPLSWKLPATLSYQVCSANHSVDDSWKDSLDTTLLYSDWSINNQPSRSLRLLQLSETPGPLFHVAIDTEFVKLQQEEIEIKADGAREIVRPTRLGLARVSVLRGSGENEGTPFIDDYITISEPVVDYVTEYSGVRDGDLDPRYSSHNLVWLKVAYKKLWLLLNLGCVFVGHGLPKDFRTINIHVPKAQVVDTADLFYKGHRRLGLKFLVWYLLKEDIQKETHDSIEDARSALKLWRKFEEFVDRGVQESMVDEVYREGRKWGFKPPGEGGGGGGAIFGLGGGGGGGAARRFEGRTTESSALSVGGIQTPDTVGLSGPGTPVGKRGVVGKSGDYFEGVGSEK